MITHYGQLVVHYFWIEEKKIVTGVNTQLFNRKKQTEKGGCANLQPPSKIPLFNFDTNH